MHREYFQFRMMRFLLKWFSNWRTNEVTFIAQVLPYLFGDFAEHTPWMEMVRKAIKDGVTTISDYNPINVNVEDLLDNLLEDIATDLPGAN